MPSFLSLSFSLALFQRRKIKKIYRRPSQQIWTGGASRSADALLQRRGSVRLVFPRLPSGRAAQTVEGLHSLVEKAIPAQDLRHPDRLLDG